MAPNGLAQRIRHLAHAPEAAVSTLRIVPFTGDSATEPPYCLLDEETARKVEVTEVGEEGTVPELLVRNGLDVHLLLVADQELIGAKQNRVLNTDVLVPPGVKLTIPVSCVEQGRWGYKPGRGVKPGSLSPSSLRAQKSSDVLMSLMMKKGYRSDQSSTWGAIRKASGAMSVSSSTDAMSDIYETYEEDLARLRKGVELPDETVGVAVYDGDRFLGMDVFDRASSFRTFWRILVDSYALEVMIRMRSAHVEVTPPEEVGPNVDRILDDLCDGEWTRHESPGDGFDYRLRHEKLTGSCLLWDDRSVLHLQVFRARVEA
jgi:hypothetical protein